jgi:hypothetical protein
MRNAELYKEFITRREALKMLLSESKCRDRLFSKADWEVSPYERSKWLIEALEARLDEAELIVWDRSLFIASQVGAKSFLDYEYNHTDFPPVFQQWQFYDGDSVAAVEFGWEKRAGIPENAYCREMFIIPLKSQRTGKWGLAWANVYWPIVGSISESVKKDGLDSIIPIFRFWPPIYDGDKPENIGPHHMLFAALGFMYSKVVSLEPVRAQRSERRRAHKLNKHLPTIQVTQLRRREYQSGGDQGDPASWSCRWIVRGHWRKQWYPKDGAHKPLFIEPHIKGPDGAPLKPPREHITVVAR